MNAALKVADSLLRGTIVIRIKWNTETHRTFDKSLAERVGPLEVGNHEFAVATAIGVVGVTLSAFEPLEIGQHGRITPTGIPHLRPDVKVHRLTAVEDVTVD